MANVITEAEIRKFRGMSQAVLPVGAVLTPAAQDWAHEQHLTLVFGEGNHPGMSLQCDSSTNGRERAAFLHQVVESVFHHMKQSGNLCSQEAIVPIVIKCLERLGCQVK